MTALFYLFLLALVLIIARYLRRSRQQEISFDHRLEQHLLKHVPQLPKPFVRVWYGPLDVQTHVTAPTRQQLLSFR